GYRDYLWRRDGLFADGSQAPGSLHQRQPLGLCVARYLLVEPAGAPGRDHDDDLSWAEHGRPLRPGRRFAGTDAYPGSEPHGWPLDCCAGPERFGALLQPGLTRAARPGRLRRRVPRVARIL